MECPRACLPPVGNRIEWDNGRCVLNSGAAAMEGICLLSGAPNKRHECCSLRVSWGEISFSAIHLHIGSFGRRFIFLHSVSLRPDIKSHTMHSIKLIIYFTLEED
jgi:hypothetical protein